MQIARGPLERTDLYNLVSLTKSYASRFGVNSHDLLRGLTKHKASLDRAHNWILIKAHTFGSVDGLVAFLLVILLALVACEDCCKSQDVQTRCDSRVNKMSESSNIPRIDEEGGNLGLADAVIIAGELLFECDAVIIMTSTYVA
jgi:hypothetical protein